MIPTKICLLFGLLVHKFEYRNINDERFVHVILAFRRQILHRN